MNPRKLIIIKTIGEYQQGLADIRKAKIVAFDTETTGLNPRKDKIIGFSWSVEAGTGYYLPLYVWNEETQALEKTDLHGKAAFTLMVLETKKLVMHNGSFDCRMVYGNYKVDLTKSLYSDTMLMKHTCDEEFPFGLKQIAKKIAHKIGFSAQEADAEKRELSAYMRMSETDDSDDVPMYKVPLEVLGKYAAADADLTMRLFDYYSGVLLRENLNLFFYEDEVMPLYREVTIPMEWHGIPIDEPKIRAGLAEINVDIAALESRILAQIEPLLPKFYNWFYNLKYPPKMSGLFPRAVAATMNYEIPVDKHGKQSLAAPAMAKQPPHRFVDFMLGRTRLLPSEILAAQKYMHGPSPAFNLSSKHHLKKLFFDILELEPLSRTEKGNPQVDSEFLEKNAQSYQWIADLVLYNKLVKLRGTYYERILNDSEDGVFYPSFGQHRTISGRYGSDIQQLPRPTKHGHELFLKYNNQIREFFISGDDFAFLDADYQSLEPRVFAHVSGDLKLIDIFKSGADFYSTIAINAERLNDYSPSPDDPNYLGKAAPHLRQRAKAYALGIPYGMSAGKLSHVLNISYEEAQTIVEDYLRQFPVLADWMDSSDTHAIVYDYISQQLGRKRRFRTRKLWDKWSNRVPTIREVESLARSDSEKDMLMKERWILKNVLNNAKNFQIQSLASSIVNRAAIAISRKLSLISNTAHLGHIESSQNAYLCANIHDQLIVRCRQYAVDKIQPVMQECMESTVKLSVDLIAQPKVGHNFREAH